MEKHSVSVYAHKRRDTPLALYAPEHILDDPPLLHSLSCVRTYIQGSSNEKPNSTMSVILCTGANFVKKNSCLVARIVLFDTVGLHLLTFHILEPYLYKDIALDLSRVISH